MYIHLKIQYCLKESQCAIMPTDIYLVSVPWLLTKRFVTSLLDNFETCGHLEMNTLGDEWVSRNSFLKSCPRLEKCLFFRGLVLSRARSCAWESCNYVFIRKNSKKNKNLFITQHHHIKAANFSQQNAICFCNSRIQ